MVEFFERFDGNVPSLVALAIILLGNALISNGYLTKMLKGRKGTGKSIADLDDRITVLCGNMNEIREEMGKLSRRVGYVDKNALMGIIYNNKIQILDRLRAFDSYLRLGGNGLVAEDAYKELILPNKGDWTRAQQESRMEPFCDNYKIRIAEINRKLEAV